jgi:hypothetical protein
METIPQVTQAMQTVLTTTAEQIGHAVGFTKRPDLAKFSASTFVQTLVFGWLAHPDARLDQLAHTAAQVGVDVSPQAIDQRFTATSAALLQQLIPAAMQHLVATDGAALPLLARFTGVRVLDSTTIALPDALAATHQGCGGRTTTHTQAALKCGVQLDLRTGALTALDLADGRQHDRTLPMQTLPMPPGTLRLADLGFYDLARLDAIGATGGYWLTRVLSTTTITRPAHTRETLLDLVRGAAADGYDGWVTAGVQTPVQARLLVQPVPPAVAAARRRRIRQAAKRDGATPSATLLELAGWTIVLTNVPEALLSGDEALVLLRVRWQIELLFKLWKSHGQIDTWRTAQPQRIRCEVYAKLLAMVIQHWAILVGCWADPERSLVKAARLVRDHAVDLAYARAHPTALTGVLTRIQAAMQRGIRINKRTNHPSTAQRLAACMVGATDA